MTESSNARPSVPVACTLDASDAAARVEQWRQLVAAHADGTITRPGQVVVRFTATPKVSAELRRLVAAERACCAFLDWEMREQDDVVELVITGDPEAVEMLSFATP